MDHDYNGAVIQSAEFGPRHELTLRFSIRPTGNTATDGTETQEVSVHFGGIVNYEEVVRAFKVANVHETLHYMRDTPGSKPTRRLVDIEFDRSEQRIRVNASHVKEDPLPPTT